MKLKFKIGDKVKKKKGFHWHNRKEITYGIVIESLDDGCYGHYTDLTVFNKNDELVKSHYSATTQSLEKFDKCHHPLTNIFKDDAI